MKVTDPNEISFLPKIYDDIERENRENYLLEFSNDSTEIKKTIFNSLNEIEETEIKIINSGQNDIISRYDHSGNLIQKVILEKGDFLSFTRSKFLLPSIHRKWGSNCFTRMNAIFFVQLLN